MKEIFFFPPNEVLLIVIKVWEKLTGSRKFLRSNYEERTLISYMT